MLYHLGCTCNTFEKSIVKQKNKKFKFFIFLKVDFCPTFSKVEKYNYSLAFKL